MENYQKEQIANHLRNYVSVSQSQKQAANKLHNVSHSTISQMVNGKWDNISDNLWRNVAAQVTPAHDWEIVETNSYTKLMELATDAQQFHNVFAVTGNAGCGKTVTFKHYAQTHANAHLVRCNEYWNRKYFLIELMRVMGRDASGLTVNEIMAEVVRQLKMQENPLIILDEADKLTDQVLYFFITLYNALEDHCGIILAATDHLEKRLKKGLRLNKKGYNEIYSRIGRRCIELKEVGIVDITQVCMANGITAKADIKIIIEKSENDLRRVKRMIHAFKQNQAKTNQTKTNQEAALEALENTN